MNGATELRANLKLVEAGPNTVNRKVAGPGAPRRPTNASLRTREYVTTNEVEKLIKAAKDGRWGDRDAAMILIAYRHRLRAQEIADLEWSQVEDGRTPTLHVRRVRNGKPSAHPIQGDEMRMLRKLPRETPYVFTTERGGQFTADMINRQVKTIGACAGLPFPSGLLHPRQGPILKIFSDAPPHDGTVPSLKSNAPRCIHSHYSLPR
jgi:integrase